MRKGKILVTPTIDGRNTMVGLNQKDAKGVRDEMEKETLAYAESVAKVMRQVTYSDGNNLEVVVPNFTVGGLADLEKLIDFVGGQQGIVANVYASPCWCYPDEVAEYNNIRINALVGKPGLSRPGMVWAAAADSGFVDRGKPVFKLDGRHLQKESDNKVAPDIAEKLQNFALCATAISTFRNTSYLSTGTSMGIPGSEEGRRILEAYLGMGWRDADMSEIRGRIDAGIYNMDEFKRAIEWWDNNCREGPDDNPKTHRWTKKQMRHQLEESIKATMIFRDMMIGNDNLPKHFSEQAKGYNASCGGFANQRHWSDYNPAGVIDTILPSSFDWDGIREPFSVATENDWPQAIMMKLGTLLTGAATLFHDNRSYWSPESVKLLIGKDLPPVYASESGLRVSLRTGFIDGRNSGDAALDGTGRQKDSEGRPTIKPWYEVTEQEAAECLKYAEFCQVIREYFNGGGKSVKYITEGGIPMTAVRLYSVDSKLRLQIAEGYSVTLPSDIAKSVCEQTNRTWPSTFFVPITNRGGKYGKAFLDTYQVFHHWRTNHKVLIPGHVGHNLITAMSIARIPVPMHNVDESRILRPTMWDAEGTRELMSVDRHVCQKLGPMYK